MVQAELTITNEQGIHLEPANKIANLADRYDCQIHFKTDYMDVNAKSIINLISGTFRHGDVVQCVCNGPDEEEALAAMKRILSENIRRINRNLPQAKRRPRRESSPYICDFSRGGLNTRLYTLVSKPCSEATNIGARLFFGGCALAGEGNSIYCGRDLGNLQKVLAFCGVVF